MGDITFTREVNTVTFTATSNPSVTIVHEFQTADSGGDGTGDVTGPASSVDGRPAVFDGTTGKVVRQGNVNSPRGLVVLDDDGTIPDILVPASIARDSEVSSAISSATSGLVASTDPRLSDARTPLGHTHALGDLTTAETSTSKVLQPDGAGGVAWGTVSGGGGAPFSEIPNRSGAIYAKSVSVLAPFAPSSADRIFYHAIPVDEIVVSGLSVVVSTAASGETWRLGLYTDNNGIPDSLIVDAGDVAADTTGARTLTFTPVTVPAGFVWVAVICSGTTSRLRGGSGGHYLIPGIMQTSIFGCYSSFVGNTYTSMPSAADVGPTINQQGAPNVGLVIA